MTSSKKEKLITLNFDKGENNNVIVKDNKDNKLNKIDKLKDKKSYSSEDIRDRAINCIKAMSLMIEPKSISKKFNIIYGPINAGIKGSLYKPYIIRLKDEFLEYIEHSVALLEINSNIFIPKEIRNQVIDRIYYIILTFSEGAEDKNNLFSELPKWDKSHKWCENGYFDEHWKFHRAEVPKGVVKSLGIYIPKNWDTLLEDEGVGFQYIVQFFRQLSWTKEDYDNIVNSIQQYLETEPSQRALLGTIDNKTGKPKGGFLYNLLTTYNNNEGEKALAYMLLYCLEINTINEKILFLQSKGGGGKDSIVEPLVKLLGGVENNAQLSINELTSEFLPAIINRSNLIYNMEAQAKDIAKASRKLNQLSGASPFEINSKNKELVPYINFTQKVLFGLNDPIYTLYSSDGSLNRRCVQYRSFWYTADDGVNPWRNYYLLNNPKFNLIIYDVNKSDIKSLPSYEKFPLLLLRYLITKWDDKISYEDIFKNYSLKGDSISDTIIDIAKESYSKVEDLYEEDLITINLTDLINKNMGTRFVDSYLLCSDRHNKFKIYNNIPIDIINLKTKDLRKTKFYMPLATINKLSKEFLNKNKNSKELQEELIFNRYAFTSDYNGGTKAILVALDIQDDNVYLTFIKN